jgi:hypothetical protein
MALQAGWPSDPMSAATEAMFAIFPRASFSIPEQGDASIYEFPEALGVPHRHD